MPDIKKIDAIAIGGFDGMHAAHQFLFAELGTHGAVVAIETGYADLTPGSHRQEHTHYPIYYYDLEDIKGLSGEGFVEKLRIKRFFDCCCFFSICGSLSCSTLSLCFSIKSHP